MALNMLAELETILHMSESSFVFPESGVAPEVTLGVSLPNTVPGLEVAMTIPRQKSQRWLESLRWAFSFPSMLGALLVTGVFVARRNFEVDTDLWWHLRVGEDILATHHLPLTDMYSFTAPGQPWIAAEWAGSTLFAIVERAGGLRGLQALFIILGATIMLSLYALATLRAGNSKAGFVTSAVLLVLATANFNLRPQMLGYLFLILLMIALERFRQGKRGALWCLPALFLVWVNSHGSWPIGLGAMFIYWASGLREFRLGGIEMRRWTPADRQRLSFVFLLCLTVLPITPYGTRLAAFPFQFISALPVNLASINEWQPMPFNLFGPKLFLALILGLFVVQIAFRLSWRLEELALFFFGTVLACLHARFLLIFVPFSAPLFATTLARWLPRYYREKDQFLLNAVLMFSFALAMVYYFPSQKKIEESIAKNYPSGAVAYMRQHSVPGPMFNSYGFGGYLQWAFGAEHKVFIDGRGELYEPGGVFADYMHIILLKPGALSVLRDYGVQSCLLNRDDALATTLSALPDWQSVYSDQTSILLVRRNTANSPVAPD
jgi:hypothetical protein